MVLKKQNKNYTKFEYWIYLVILIGAGVLYYSLFERAVISPQTGWWQYMAWRMSEGELPYRDFFLYVPPYFALLTQFLFSFFGFHFIFYTVFGFLFTRVLMWIFLYNILTKYSHPRSVAIGIFTGICITSSYLADQCYDYNPLILTLAILMAYILQLIYLSDKKSNMYFGGLIEGIICGILLFMKQNVGIVMPIITVGCILLLYYLKKNNIRTLICNILIFASGCILGILPGIVYLIKNHIFMEFINCITNAINAKTSNSNFLFVAIKNFFNPLALSIALLIVVLFFTIKKQILQNNKILLSLILCSTILLIINLFGTSIIGFLQGISVNKIVGIGVALFLCFAFFCIKKKMNISPKQFSDKYLYYLLWIILFGGIIITCQINDVQAELLYQGIHFNTLKSNLLYIVLYVDILLWLYMLYKIFIKKSDDYNSLLFPSLVLILFMGVSFVSAKLEELYAIIIVPIFVIIFLEKIYAKSRLKNTIIYLLCFGLSLICLSEKLLLPYDWHGWTLHSLLSQENPTVEIDVTGLEGFKIAQTDADAYEDIVKTIKDNSEEKDILYQFPNMLLFNVLTERKTIYGAVPYFDVCPDNLAIESAAYLEQNQPELVLYSELNEGRWDIHELYFRNGAISGQRKIQEFYEKTVKNTYRQLGAYDNRSGDPLCLWKKTAYTTGPKTRTVEISGNFEIMKKIKFTKENIDTFCLSSPSELLGKNLQIVIKDITDNKIIYKDQMKFSSSRMGYYEAKMDEISVDTSHLYNIEVEAEWDDSFEVDVTGYENEDFSNENICITLD